MTRWTAVRGRLEALGRGFRRNGATSDLALLRVRNSPFLGNLRRLASYTVAGQALSLLAAPILTRIFTPAEFGLYGIFLGFSVTATVLTTLFYDGAIPAARTDEEAMLLAIGSAGIAAILSVVLAGIYLAMILMGFFGYGALPLWSPYLLWILLLSQAVVSICQYWFVRQQVFNGVGQGILMLHVGRAAAQIGLGAVGIAWAALPLGEIGGRMANAARLLPPLLGRWRLDVPRHEFWQKLQHTLTRYKRFPLILLPAMVADTIVLALLIGAINYLFGPVAAGQYFLMSRSLDLPMSFIGGTISEPFYGKMAEIVRTDPTRLRPFVLRVFAGLFLGASVMLLPILVFGPAIFDFVFGAQWELAGLLAAIMVPAALMNLAVLPITRVFALTSRPSLRYVFSVVNAAGAATACVLAWKLSLDIVWTVVAISAARTMAYAAYLIAALYAASHLDHEEHEDPGQAALQN